MFLQTHRLRLKFALSKITFLRISKNSSNFVMTVSYRFLSSSVGLVNVSTESASSSRQYSNVLICLKSASPSSPEATRNCWKHRFHSGQSSGVLKLNGSGGCNWMFCMSFGIGSVTLPPCSDIVLSIIGKSFNNNKSYRRYEILESSKTCRIFHRRLKYRDN